MIIVFSNIAFYCFISMINSYPFIRKTYTLLMMTDKHTLTIKHNIKILSWNIQSSNSTIGNKFEDTDFTDSFLEFDLVCLQEIRQAVKCPGFRAICSVREGERSGGVCILYKNQLAGGVERVKNKTGGLKDIVVCKLKRSFFNFDEDVFIVNAYVTPQNSSSSNTAIPNGSDTLYQIQNTVNDLQRIGKVVLCGDMNARIGNHPGILTNETIDDYIPLPVDYKPDTYSTRHSEDTVTNTYGKRFISLVMNTRLTILNGRTLGDLHGAFTSIQVGGCSVIDYFAISNEIHNCVTSFRVLDFTQFSDHKPISLELSCNPLSVKSELQFESLYESAPTSFKTINYYQF